MEEERKIRPRHIAILDYAQGVKSMVESITRSGMDITFIDIKTAKEKFKRDYMPIYAETKIINPDVQLVSDKKVLFKYIEPVRFSSKHQCTRHRKPRVKKKKTHLKKKRR